MMLYIALFSNVTVYVHVIMTINNRNSIKSVITN